MANHLTSLVGEVCPDSKIASKMRVNCTKMAGAVNTIADVMHADLVKKLKAGWWSLILDESADISVKEQVSVSARLFDDGSSKVRTLSLGVIPIVSATAENIFKTISDLLSKDGIDRSRFVAFGSNGARVRGTKTVMTRMVEQQPSLFTVHCTCHIAHPCALAAVKVIPGNLDEFLKLVVHFFEKSTKRSGVFESYEVAAGVKVHKLLKPSNTRWPNLH